MIRVLIVEDDPMVAEINKKYLCSVKGFSCAGAVKNAKEAMGFIKKYKVDLVLLDIFMPGKNGIELLVEIRNKDKSIDAIVISAASDIQSIKSALRLGSVDYLIKPFEFERFNSALMKYKEEFELMNKKGSIAQEELDNQLLRQNKMVVNQRAVLPKGLTQQTLQRVVDTILMDSKEKFSTENLAAQVGVSRVSMRKYLKFLAEIEMVSVEMNYKKTGRPIHTYYINKENTDRIKPYLKATSM
ncbi:response regulator [Pseudalkalibacillus decolorationis]|uniref:response regulator n=1 Tax=Pseudalkalibacillus decolorationis TaxID=163879 RepID=UPI002148CA36|nr:response regulator [Pseudalkalibacillus decolorationis]